MREAVIALVVILIMVLLVIANHFDVDDALRLRAEEVACEPGVLVKSARGERVCVMRQPGVAQQYYGSETR